MNKYDLEPIFATKILEPRPPDDKVEELLKKSDVFIAVITKEVKVEGSNWWRGPEWVQNEIGMAVQQKKPFALFIENGIDLNQGIAHLKTEYVVFDRNNLQEVRDKAETLIEGLKKQVANVGGTQALEDAVIEEPASSSGFINVGRFLIMRTYGKLDVNLWKTYLVLAILSIPSAYFVYDYMVGYKIVGLWGYIISLFVIIVSLVFVSSAEGTKCRKCGSYFSVRERPVLASDISGLPALPDTRRYHKWVCDLCKDVKIKARRRPTEETED